MLQDHLWTLALALPFAAVSCWKRASGATCAKAKAPVRQPVALPPPVLDIDAEPVSPDTIECAAPPLPEPPPKPARTVAPRRAVNPHEAVMRFCVWMRDWGFVGWHPADDIVEFYQWFCDDEGLEEMGHDLLRERFACAPGVTRERRRLNGTTDKEMVRIKRCLGGADRAMLYRVSSHEELAEQAKDPRPGKKRGNKRQASVDTVSTTIMRRAA